MIHKHMTLSQPQLILKNIIFALLKHKKSNLMHENHQKPLNQSVSGSEFVPYCGHRVALSRSNNLTCVITGFWI